MQDIIQPLINFFHAILVFIHDTFGFSWGWSIVALTVMVRAALLPLTFKSMRSMRALAHLQPEMKKLQERYKGDKERLNQEMMKFYRENKVNPFASCLPMLLQIPVFISLFYMLQDDLRIDICGSDAKPCGTPNAEFLIIPDLTAEATGWVLVTLVVIYVASQLASTLLSMQTADRTQRLIFMALPIVFVPFIINFPAGLLVYWITTNLWTIVQGAIIRKRIGPMRPPLAEGEKAPSFMESIRNAAGVSDGDDGKKAPARTKETARVGGSEPKGRPSGPPPAPPRRKKKRSGRRR